MKDNKERKYPAAEGEQSGGLNADDAPFIVGLNQWVNAENVRVGTTDAGATGVVESIGSTQLLSAFPNPKPRVNIGWAEEPGRNRFCVFYQSTFEILNSIECFDATANQIYTVVLGTQVTGGLDFQRNSIIHSARIVNGVLYWTDNYNQPRKINIDSGIKLNHPTYVTTQVAYTLPIAQEVIALIRKPPAIPPIVGKVTVPSITVNNIADFAGQFAARYIYREGEESVLSPISTLASYNNSATLSNAIRVSFAPSNFIEQDVLQVDLCVRFGNSGNFFVIRSWNKNIPADADAIAANNAGTGGLTYLFFNDKTGIALSSAYSVKPYDSVPLLSKTLETALDRLFLGDNLVGYDFHTTTPIRISFTTAVALPVLRVFKSATDIKFGIVFRDRYKRVIGGVVTNDNLRVSIPDRTYAFFPMISSIEINFIDNSGIPIDAVSYDVVVTKNLRTRFFVQSKVMAANMRYAVKDPISGIISYQTNYVVDAYGIALDATLLNAAGMGYLYQQGDIAKLYLDTGTITTLQVITQDANYIIVARENLGNWGTVNVIYEIYTPYKESANEPFYTMGTTALITNPGTPSRNYSSGVSIVGDVYPLLRPDGVAGYITENMSPNDNLWRNWFANWGEPNFVFLSKQIRKYTAVQYSNVYIQGTQINGLSTFDALDEKILPLSMGELNKLQQTSKTQEQGNVMLAIGSADTASLYLGEVQLVGASQNAYIASSPSVIGTVNILKGNFGTINPESVSQYRGVVIWLDMINGRVIQYASNGLYPISDYKMTRFWKLFCKQFMSMTTAQIEALGGRPFVFSIVDPRHDEVLFSIPKLLATPPKGYLPDYPDKVFPFDIYDGQGKTVVYSLTSNPNKWLGSYAFNPEGFATLNNELYGFKTGYQYLHNLTTSFCNFYGVQYKPRIMLISNMVPQRPKVYNNISVESNLKPTFVYFYNNYPIQQSSDLEVDDFRDLEGVFYARLYRNKLVPTVDGYTTDGLLTAEKMRNVAMFFMVEFTSTDVALELKFVEIGFTISQGHTT